MQQLWKLIWQFFRIKGVAVSLDPAISLISDKVTIAVMIHHDQGTWVGKGLIQFTLPQQCCSSLQSGQERKQCMDPNAAVDVEATVRTGTQTMHGPECSSFTKPRTTSSGLAPCTIRQTILHHLDLM